MRVLFLGVCILSTANHFCSVGIMQCRLACLDDPISIYLFQSTRQHQLPKMSSPKLTQIYILCERVGSASPNLDEWDPCPPNLKGWDPHTPDLNEWDPFPPSTKNGTRNI